MAHFLAMGGYAAYVWPAYGVSVAGLVGAAVLTLQAYANAKQQLARAEQGDTP